MNKDDIEKIYCEYIELVYKYLLCLTGDACMAEELSQETFYQAIKGIDRFRGECKISVWLCQIGKNLWYKELRSKNRNAIPLDDIIEMNSDDSVEDYYILNSEKIELFMSLQCLDSISREVVYLRITGELSFAQIGKILGKSENWARVSFYRSKLKIMKGMKKDES
ncbi:RNA polymerase sigma-70 factor (ECF subfamily) [Lachnotalea glycerini]|uniref:RNA polymerase sigma-70 factor (ECF subfamily) n=1 Tax=Lachnotalea glycerini TaxID=1763509 RepID=A0A255I1K8_9FIRM|nr:sigma-70 family RNA polymerase sigma factor [Lachnotalea glycerini]OYO76066.1 RNA polymerase subunit sigma [Lachnotalea glycerini]PXV91057.1 RNA polymerase sigma-70 factor (ECF subfamily) [Lachnotalea glycerini]RDY30068.1 sigma-70 family RNA polymerase sigma factor [Lachnotalea glycerini]